MQTLVVLLALKRGFFDKSTRLNPQGVLIWSKPPAEARCSFKLASGIASGTLNPQKQYLEACHNSLHVCQPKLDHNPAEKNHASADTLQWQATQKSLNHDKVVGGLYPRRLQHNPKVPTLQVARATT